MTYFADLSPYAYFPEEWRPFTQNVGWLVPGEPFHVAPPDPGFVTRLRRFCTISVVQTRGLHECAFCDPPATVSDDDPEGSILLGSAEIRVFSAGPAIYAAPTLIHHYVAAHHYAPPAEFVRAVEQGPCPPAQEYFDRLEALQLAWRKTSPRSGPPFRLVPLPP